MNKTEYFNYSKVALELNVPGNILDDIIHDAKIEFPKESGPTIVRYSAKLLK